MSLFKTSLWKWIVMRHMLGGEQCRVPRLGRRWHVDSVCVCVGSSGVGNWVLDTVCLKVEEPSRQADL